MKVTFIATVFNEEASIDAFMKSLLNQTRKPDEVIIVDGGSTDHTYKKLVAYKKKFSKIPITVITKKGNRSAGRNTAISQSKYQLIAVSDAGCRLHKTWLEEITKPFTKKIDVVSGFYKPDVKTLFEKALSTYTCVMEEKLNESFNPSSRSVAFRKRIWNKVGGYPEQLDTCEDMVFVKKLRDQGATFFLQKKAIVFWKQKSNLFEAFIQFYSYAKGDGQAFYIRPQTYLLYFRYLLLIFLIVLFLQQAILVPLLLVFFGLYSFWSITKNYRYIRNIRAVYLLPLLQYTADLAVLGGTTRGLLERKI